MNRMVFSLSVARTPYQGRYLYIGAWTALGLESCEAPVSCALSRGAAPLASRTGWWYIDTRLANFSRSAPPGKHFPAGRLPGLHHIVDWPDRNSTIHPGNFTSSAL